MALLSLAAPRSGNVSSPDLFTCMKNILPIKLGCTFTPEKYPDQDSVQDGFSFVLKKMKMKYIRFPLRWNQIQQPDGILSLERYKSYFETVSIHSPQANICLNIGPLKTADWPEVHAPDKIIDKHQPLPHWPTELQKNHPLIQESAEYLHQLCRLLRNEMPQKSLDAIDCFQLNNEGFNPFGHHNIVMSVETELFFESIVHAYFPGRQTLFNSSGRLQLGKCLEAGNKSLSPARIGIDYYYHTPYNDKPIIKNIDTLDLPFFWTPSMKKTIREIEKSRHILEFTETQMEKWGHITYPGNSVQALESIIQRLVKYKPKHQEALLLRLWGVELLSYEFIKGTQTNEQEKMLELIQHYNTKV